MLYMVQLIYQIVPNSRDTSKCRLISLCLKMQNMSQLSMLTNTNYSCSLDAVVVDVVDVVGVVVIVYNSPKSDNGNYNRCVSDRTTFHKTE